MRVLIVQPDTNLAHTLTRLFVERKDTVWKAWDLGQASAAFFQLRPDLLVFDLHCPDAGWQDFLRKVQRANPRLIIIATNQKPDLQRELLLKEMGIRIIWRAPFAHRWLEKIFQRLANGEYEREDALRKPDSKSGQMQFPMSWEWVVVSAVLLVLTILASLIFQSWPLVGLLAVLLLALIGLLVAGRFSRATLKVVAAVNQVAEGNLNVKLETHGNDELAVLSRSFNSMVADLQEGYIYRDIVGYTVSPELRAQLHDTFTSGSLLLEGQETMATVLITDIRGFTQLAEGVEPAVTLKWLNEYFNILVKIINFYGGVVNKLDGDNMQAFFGILPKFIPAQDGAFAGCRAALEIVQAMVELNRKRATREEPPFTTSIGLHTGNVLAGGLATGARMNYVVMGEPVNTAQRLESLTRQLLKATGVLTSQATITALGDRQSDFSFENLGAHAVKGKAERVQIYHLLPHRELPPLKVML
jgi:class 3 adenylate cyclase/HAMP domain-containing protein